ncbi:hypothetical protein KM043_005280 [Ampulex compressa]|nr:hypothetical protein KM043_005280 [Ampulex compressa]
MEIIGYGVPDIGAFYWNSSGAESMRLGESETRGGPREAITGNNSEAQLRSSRISVEFVESAKNAEAESRRRGARTFLEANPSSSNRKRERTLGQPSRPVGTTERPLTFRDLARRVQAPHQFFELASRPSACARMRFTFSLDPPIFWQDEKRAPAPRISVLNRTNGTSNPIPLHFQTISLLLFQDPRFIAPFSSFLLIPTTFESRILRFARHEKRSRVEIPKVIFQVRTLLSKGTEIHVSLLRSLRKCPETVLRFPASASRGKTFLDRDPISIGNLHTEAAIQPVLQIGISQHPDTRSLHEQAQLNRHDPDHPGGYQYSPTFKRNSVFLNVGGSRSSRGLRVIPLLALEQRLLSSLGQGARARSHEEARGRSVEVEAAQCSQSDSPQPTVALSHLVVPSSTAAQSRGGLALCTRRTDYGPREMFSSPFHPPAWESSDKPGRICLPFEAPGRAENSRGRLDARRWKPRSTKAPKVPLLAVSNPRS